MLRDTAAAQVCLLRDAGLQTPAADLLGQRNPRRLLLGRNRLTARPASIRARATLEDRGCRVLL